MNNGMDRDVAELMLQAFTTADTLVETINDNLFVPHIITQPTDQEVAVAEGATATFTVVANNIVTYQWQYKNNPDAATWYNSTATGATTDTLTVVVESSSRYNTRYRCRMVGKDGSAIVTNIVKVVEPAPDPET